MTITRFSFPTTIQFGPGASKLAGAHLKERGLKRPLVVTDKGLAALPLLGEFAASLSAAGLAPSVYAGVFGNPTASQVMNGAAAYRAHGADCVVGIGGGAALDVAKVVGLLATHEGDVMEYVWDHPQVRPIGETLAVLRRPADDIGHGQRGRAQQRHQRGGDARQAGRLLAADPGPGGVRRSGADGRPAAGGDRRHRHGRADAQRRELPFARPTTRCATASPSKARASPPGRWRWRCASPATSSARGDMMMSSMMGAIAFQKDLGAVHSCAHALGTVCDMHHGLANALMIDTVLAWNAEAVPKKFDELAHAVGVSGGAAGFLAWLKALKQEIGIAPSLTKAGVERAAIPQLVAIATADICHQTNPRPVTSSDFERLFAGAM